MKGIRWNRPWRIASHARGFTLIELLVVIAIIALLAALLIPVATGAIRAAKNAQIAVEVGEIAKALQQFKVQYGAYPPDFSLDPTTDATQLEQFMARNFRNRNAANDRLADKNGGKVDWKGWGLDPSESLFFWLGGETHEPGQTASGGLSKDPFLPKVGSIRIAPIFPFDKTRLRDSDGDGFYEYYPKGINKPYVYLASANYIQSTSVGLPIVSGDTVRPYVRKNPPNVQQDYVEDSGFQLICAGLDNEFGVLGNPAAPNVFPTGPYTEGHEDNVTNFSEGTLESKLP